MPSNSISKNIVHESIFRMTKRYATWFKFKYWYIEWSFNFEDTQYKTLSTSLDLMLFILSLS